MQEEKIKDTGDGGKTGNGKQKKAEKKYSEEKRVHSFTQHLSANMTVVSTTDFRESRLLSLSFLTRPSKLLK